MPKLTGLFDSFDNLDQISAEAIASWLKPVPQLIQLENYLANKILYPQTLPLTEHDMQIDLAILREALKMSKAFADAINGPQKNTFLGDNSFLNTTLRKVLIPARFLNFVPNLTTLTGVFIDALLLNRKKEDWFQDLWTVVLTDSAEEVVGSVLLPQFEDKNGIMNFSIHDKNYQLRSGGLMMLPCSTDRCEIAYKLQKGKILGKKESAVEVSGGKLGLMIDGRNI